MLALRPMEAGDLALVRSWLREPGVARWYLSASTLEDEIEDLRRCIAGEEPTEGTLTRAEAARRLRVRYETLSAALRKGGPEKRLFAELGEAG